MTHSRTTLRPLQKRLGFTREVHLLDHHFDGQCYDDVIGFGLLRSESPLNKESDLQ